MFFILAEFASIQEEFDREQSECTDSLYVPHLPDEAERQ